MMKTIAKCLFVIGLVLPFLMTVKHMTTVFQLQSSGAEDVVMEREIATSTTGLTPWVTLGLCSIAVGILLYSLSHRKTGDTQDGP